MVFVRENPMVFCVVCRKLKFPTSKNKELEKFRFRCQLVKLGRGLVFVSYGFSKDDFFFFSRNYALYVLDRVDLH